VLACSLLTHYDATRLTAARVQYVVEQIYKRAGLRSAVPAGALVHALRHSFASIAVEYGTDVVELRDLLGHASLATTSRYLDAEAGRLREAVAAHPSQRALDHLTA
jgi:site-specific recombinase XerD